MCFNDTARAVFGKNLPTTQNTVVTSVTPPPKAPDANAATPAAADNSGGDSGGATLDSLMIPRTTLAPVSRDVPKG